MKEILTILAATIPTGDPSSGGVGVPKVEAAGILEGTLSVVYYAAGITAVIVLIIGGILYTVSDGDSSKIKRAKDMILYAIVGLVFVLMAFVITNFIIGRF